MPTCPSLGALRVVLRPAVAAAIGVATCTSVAEAQTRGPTRWVATWAASMCPVPLVNVQSDPVPGRVPSLASVAVSLYFPDTAYVSTFAVGGPQLSYTSEPGDHAAERAFPVESAPAAWMFRSAVWHAVDNGALPHERSAFVRPPRTYPPRAPGLSAHHATE